MRTIILSLIIVAGCGATTTTTKQQAGYVRDGVVDCTTAAAQQAISEYQPTVEALLAVDRPRAEQTLRNFGKVSGACVLANIIAGIVSGKLGASSGPRLTADEARAVFDTLRAQWDGARYKTDAGLL